MDYGCIIYDSARKTKLKQLESIQGTALRLAIGGFRTSPYIAVNCETGIPPLYLRRKQLLLNYASNIHTQPAHPNYRLLFNHQRQSLFSKRPTITRPVCVRITETSTTFSVNLPKTFEQKQLEIPPWLLVIPKIYLNNGFKKSETNKTLLLTAFWSVLEKYPNSQIIYTDGSKTDHGVSSAFVSCETSFSWTLPKCTSVYTAELFAILKAIEYVSSRPYKTTLICSDSLSSLQALSSAFTTDPIVQEILSIITNLKDYNDKFVHLVWTPGHVGIRGNETADQLAKEATERDIDINIPIRHMDVKDYTKSSIREIWQNEWDNGNAKLKDIKSSVKPWCFPISLKKREEVGISRLRLGHTRLTSSYILLGAEQPRCDECDAYLTVKHILTECRKYSMIRQRIGMSEDLAVCLNNEARNVEKMVTFLHDTNLLNEI